MNKRIINKKSIVVIIVVLFLLLIPVKVFVVKIGHSYYPIWTNKICVYNSNEQMKEKDFRNLKRMKNISELELWYEDYNDISFIYSMPKLKKMIISGFSINNNVGKKLDFSNISSLQNLETVLIAYVNIENINDISNIKTLKNLSVYGVSESVDFLDCQNDSLKYLHLEAVTITNFKGIENLKNLNTLFIGNEYSKTEGAIDPDSVVDISPVGKLENLKELTVSDYPYQIDISKITNKSLKEIEIINCHTNEISSDWIVSLPSVENITVVGSKISDIKKICKSKTLKKITISQEFYTDDVVHYLRENGIEVNCCE